jgi:hypothetical protein
MWDKEITGFFIAALAPPRHVLDLLTGPLPNLQISIASPILLANNILARNDSWLREQAAFVDYNETLLYEVPVRSTSLLARKASG